MRAELSSPIEVAVFTRAPVAGEVKTRLMPLLGARGAATLHCRLLDHALGIATAAGARVTLWVAGGEDHPLIVERARRFGVRVAAQRGADLGARMQHAFAITGTPLVLIGTDCPALQSHDLAAAAAALVDHVVVLQPAADGGYVLIALAQPQPSLFEGIEWGTRDVLRETMRRVHTAALRCLLRPALEDLDTAADYRRALAAGTIAPVEFEA